MPPRLSRGIPSASTQSRQVPAPQRNQCSTPCPCFFAPWRCCVVSQVSNPAVSQVSNLRPVDQPLGRAASRTFRSSRSLISIAALLLLSALAASAADSPPVSVADAVSPLQPLLDGLLGKYGWLT